VSRKWNNVIWGKPRKASPSISEAINA